MSQVIPIGICKLRDTNEGEVENSVKIIEKRKAKIQLQTRVLKPEVDNYNHENVVLGKQANCTESLCQKLEDKISELKSKTESAACCLELIKWKLYKAYMLKEFENETNKDIVKQKFKYEQFVNNQTQTDNLNDAPQINSCLQSLSNDGLKILKEKTEGLLQEIDQKKKARQSVDSSLQMDKQILERRNAALIVRYQRQVQETESRYRQTLGELNSLQKLFIEKDKLFTSLS